MEYMIKYFCLNLHSNYLSKPVAAPYQQKGNKCEKNNIIIQTLQNEIVIKAKEVFLYKRLACTLPLPGYAPLSYTNPYTVLCIYCSHDTRMYTIIH